jgi:hypothetical protein
MIAAGKRRIAGVWRGSSPRSGCGSGGSLTRASGWLVEDVAVSSRALSPHGANVRRRTGSVSFGMIWRRLRHLRADSRGLNESHGEHEPTKSMKCRICGNPVGNREYVAREMMFGLRDSFVYFQCAECRCLQIAEFPADMSRYYPASYYSCSGLPHPGAARVG